MFLCYRKIEIFKIFSEIEMKPKRQLFRIIITISYFVIFVTRKKFQVFVKINRHVKNVNSRNYHLILIVAQNHFVDSSGLGGLLFSLSTWDIFKSPYTLKESVVIISLKHGLKPGCYHGLFEGIRWFHHFWMTLVCPCTFLLVINLQFLLFFRRAFLPILLI